MHATLNQARQALFLEDKPDEALDVLADLTKNLTHLELQYRLAVGELVGLAYERKGLYEEAGQTFITIGDRFQSGYCYMLLGRLDKATDCWRSMLADRPNHWCLILHGMVTSTLNALPTFLQIRNHIEADVIHLLRAGQEDMVTSLLRYVDVLSDINYECYKYVGRALFNAGKLEKAAEFLLKGQRTLPNDPEVYYHLGQYYHAVGQLEEAALMLHQCLLISATYTPARELHDAIHDRSSCPI